MIWDHKSIFGFSQRNAPLAIETRCHNWGVKVEQSPFLFKSAQKNRDNVAPPPFPRLKKALQGVDGVIRVTKPVATMNTGETRAPTSRSSPQSARLISSNNSKLADNRVNLSNLFFRYQKPTDFHRKRLNLLTQKPLYLHVTLNVLDD